MRSAARLKSHPIHPMLIPFPIAFLTGALVTDLVGAIRESGDWWFVGGWLALAGIVTALVAAVPGLVDYLYTVPPNSSARKRATYHMLVNISAVILFALGWMIRSGDLHQPSWTVVLLEVIAAGLMSMGGWLGGTLAYRNQIGVDHRYANAGKWNEQWIDEPTDDVVDLGPSDQLQVDQMKLVHLGSRRIVLARLEDGYAAFDDRCTHRGGTLAGGVVMCGKVQCPWHGSQFDCRTGEVRAGPAETPINTYRVEDSNGRLRLVLVPGV